MSDVFSQQRLTSWRPPKWSCSSRNPANPSSSFRLATTCKRKGRNVRRFENKGQVEVCVIYERETFKSVGWIRYQSDVMYKIHSWFISTNLGQFLQRGQFYPGSVPGVTTLRHLSRLFTLRFSDFDHSRFTTIRTELRKFPVTRTMYNTS